jgi:hypothetical protein
MQGESMGERARRRTQVCKDWKERSAKAGCRGRSNDPGGARVVDVAKRGQGMDGGEGKEDKG